MPILYGIGVGPGDPELLTLKAVRIIRECDAIFVPTKEVAKSVAYRIVREIIPEIEYKEIIAVDMPMTKDKDLLDIAHKDAISNVISKLDEGKNIAFLTLGDPSIYSTYMYIHQAVKQKGLDAQIISGIPSFIAAASLINDSLVLKDESMIISPATFGFEEALQLPGTKVFMKAGSKLSEIKKMLHNTDKKIFFIENYGMDNETLIEGVENIPDTAGYYSLLVVYDR